jgi:hypothetical protein
MSIEFPIPDSPMSEINGPGITLAQRLRLSRDIAYREIGVSDVK